LAVPIDQRTGGTGFDYIERVTAQLRRGFAIRPFGHRPTVKHLPSIHPWEIVMAVAPILAGTDDDEAIQFAKVDNDALLNA